MTITNKDPKTLIARARVVCKDATPGPWEVHEVDCEQYDDDEETGSRGIRSTHPTKGGGLNHGEEVELFTREDATFIATARTLVPALADALESALKEVTCQKAHAQLLAKSWPESYQSAYRQMMRYRDEAAGQADTACHELADHKAKMVDLLADAYEKGRTFGKDEDDRTSEHD